MKDEPHALRRGDPRSAPRCGARTRRQTSCLAPAMRNGRCRMHGGASTGPKTAQGLANSRRSNWRHGLYSMEAVLQRKQARAVLRQCQALLEAWT
jgi:hypothetical protein